MITTQLYNDVCHIIEQGRQNAYAAVNRSMIETYWRIGQRIVEEEQQGKERAEYGEKIIENLSKQLTLQYLTWSHVFKALRVEDPVAMR